MSTDMHKVWMTIFLTVIIIVLTRKSATAVSPLLHPQVINFIREAATGEWFNEKNQGVTIFVCERDPRNLLEALLASQWLSLRILSNRSWNRTVAKIIEFEPQEKLTYVVDVTCPPAGQLLYQAGNARLTKIPNRWILLNITEPKQNGITTLTSPSNNSADGASCRSLAIGLAEKATATTSTDSDIILVCGTAGNTLDLVDMWSAAPLGTWWPRGDKGFSGDRRPPAVRRSDMGLNGRNLTVALLITRNDTLEHMDDGINIQHDSMTKFNWEIVQNTFKLLNVTAVLRYASTFGYNVNGSWNGIIGMQVRGEAEMSGTSLAVVPNRFSIVKFSNFAIPARGSFIFRAPPMSYEHNLFLQPFPRYLWFAVIGIVSLCAVLLYGVLRIEELVGIEDKIHKSGIPWQMISEGRKRRLNAEWSDVALLAFGAVCQQGSPTEARGLTGRIITLSLFIGILFLYTSYSASIVALLQSTSTSIRTYKDLLHSKIALGAENLDYNMYYMNALKDPIRKTIYEKKIKKNFMSLEEGVRRLRKSYFAFHTVQSLIYTEIAETFQENEKCGLQEIQHFLSIQDPQLTVSHWSENAELVMLTLVEGLWKASRKAKVERFTEGEGGRLEEGSK